MKYELDKTSGSARRGRLVFERPQGTFSVETPAFYASGHLWHGKRHDTRRSACDRCRNFAW